MPTIKVKINKFGDAKVEVEGGMGQSCLQSTAGLEAALNGQQQARELKPEYHYEDQEQTQENG